MINQQLVDFIKQQLQVGSTKEKISNQLLTNGWTTQDIEEGFRATVPPTITPPVSPYSGASYIQNTNPIKTAEPQQQTFQPQVQQQPIQQIQPSAISVVHPFVKHGLIIGIVGIVFFVASFLFSNIEKASITTLAYLVAFEIAISLISVFCIMLVAKILKCKDRTFVKALSVFGASGLLGVLIYLITLLKLPDFIYILLTIGEIVFIFFFLMKIYSISILRTLSLLLLDILFMLIITLILFFTVGFSFLFSLANSIQKYNTNYTNSIQQPITTQDQTQQVEQNNTTQAPDNTSIYDSTSTIKAPTPINSTLISKNSQLYTNLGYGFSFQYPKTWKYYTGDGYDSIKAPLDMPFKGKEDLKIYISSYETSMFEYSLKQDGIQYTKDIISLGDIQATRILVNQIKTLGNNSYHEREYRITFPNKGTGNKTVEIDGTCSTFITGGGECSTAINDVMDTVISTFKFN